MIADTLDMDLLAGWIGRSEDIEDILTPRMIREYEATFAPYGFAPDDAAPLGIHWCLAPLAAPSSQLGPDGHPARGGFMPPVPLKRRMWAGGQIDFIASLRLGDKVSRHSKITGVKKKDGESGPMVFVTVMHEYSTDRGLALRDRQDVVYLNPMGKMPSAAPRTETDMPRDGLREIVPLTSTLLFRYSAITFNGHRIHYDGEYARSVEGYPDLVVHGPMQASFLLQYGARQTRGRALKSFGYRSYRPLFCNEPLVLNVQNTGDTLKLWTSGTSMSPAMQAELSFVKSA